MKSNHCGELKKELSAFSDSHMNLLVNTAILMHSKTQSSEKRPADLLRDRRESSGGERQRGSVRVIVKT
jgi:hypothetical protein